MKRHCWSYQVGVPRGRLFPSGLCLSAISQVVLAWPDPLPTGLNGDGKNVQTLWWVELDRLHSMTQAHPLLLRSGKIIVTCLELNRNNQLVTGHNKMVKNMHTHNIDDKQTQSWVCSSILIKSQCFVFSLVECFNIKLYKH